MNRVASWELGHYPPCWQHLKDLESAGLEQLGIWALSIGQKYFLYLFYLQLIASKTLSNLDECFLLKLAGGCLEERVI